jgi:leucyl-tRNA synthetase
MIYCKFCANKNLSWFNTLGKNHQSSIINHQSSEMVGWFPVEDKDLPVKLPYVENFKPLGTGEAPLSQDPEFMKVECPNCGAPAKRETDVCDTFLDSSWYFLRYPSTDFDTVPFDTETTRKWLPVNIYIGGAEHSVLHLLYSRFVTHVLYDLKYLEFDEPFPKFRAHGLIIKEGAKMSKSRGNVVNPDVYVEKFGADAIRLYLMFLGPFKLGGDFRDSGMEGMARFVKKIFRFVNYQLEGSSDTFLSNEKLDKVMNKTVKFVTSDLENLSYNTAIARIMEYVNELTKEGGEAKIDTKYIRTLLLILAPFAPYLTDELFHNIDPKAKSIHVHEWPSFDESKTQDSQIVIAIQVNGKLRDILSIDMNQSSDEAKMKALAMKSTKIQIYIQDKEIKRTIYVPGKIINIVI